MFRLYEIDPDADTLIIVPVSVLALKTMPGGSARLSDSQQKDEVELRIKVSSKHLCLASGHFRDKFKWADANTTQPDGRVHLTLEGLDPNAIIIAMNVIHARGARVPRLVELETLANIALFVDKYRCHDAIDIHAERWIEKLAPTLPNTYTPDLIRWIFIAYVFRQGELFKSATRIAVTQSSGPVDKIGLPIRAKIIRTIDDRRQSLVHQTLDVLLLVINNLRASKTSCPLGCDSFLLGALIKALHHQNLGVWSSSSKPFSDVSFAAVAQAIRDVQAQRWPPQVGSKRKRKTPNGDAVLLTPPQSPPELEIPGSNEARHECGVKLDILPQLEAVEEGISGLDLESSLGHYLY